MTVTGPGPVPAVPEDHDDFEAAFEAALGKIVATVLSALGPMTVDDLCEALGRIGALNPLIGRGYDEEEQQCFVDCLVASDEDRFFETAEDRFAHLATLLDGIVLTHRVTGSELRRSMLDVTPDLCLLTRWRRTRFGLDGGGTATLRYPWSGEAMAETAGLGIPRDPAADEDGSLVSRTGWLEGLAPGDLLAVRHNDGVLSVGRALVPPAGESVRSVLMAAFERHACGDEATTVDVLLEALAHDPTLLRVPVPPLTEIFEGLGLGRDSELIGRILP